MDSQHSRLCNAVAFIKDRFDSSQIDKSSSPTRTNIEATCRPGAPITCTALGSLVPTWNQPSDSVADAQVGELTFLVTHDLTEPTIPIHHLTWCDSHYLRKPMHPSAHLNVPTKRLIFNRRHATTFHTSNPFLPQTVSSTEKMKTYPPAKFYSCGGRWVMFMRWRWGGSGLPDAGCRVRHMLCVERSGVGWPLAILRCIFMRLVLAVT
jgi:hypothetical protein